MADNCPFWKNTKCAPPGEPPTHNCSYSKREYDNCAVYKLHKVKTAGGSMKEQFRAAAGSISPGARVMRLTSEQAIAKWMQLRDQVGANDSFTDVGKNLMMFSFMGTSPETILGWCTSVETSIRQGMARDQLREFVTKLQTSNEFEIKTPSPPIDKKEQKRRVVSSGRLISPLAQSPAIEDRILELIESGQQIAAIKEVKDHYGISLKEAKQFCDELRGDGRHDPKAPSQFASPPSPSAWVPVSGPVPQARELMQPARQDLSDIRSKPTTKWWQFWKGSFQSKEAKATELHLEAMSLYKQCQYERALVVEEKALEMTEEAHGPDAPSAYRRRDNLARWYIDQDQYAQAELLYKRALAIAEKAVGSDHPFVAGRLEFLANFYDIQRQYAQAEPLYKRSLAITEKDVGVDHYDVISNLDDLAVLYSKQGFYAQAEPLFKRSLAIKEKEHLQDDPLLSEQVAESLENIASLYRKTDREKEAEVLEERAAAIRAIKR